MLMGISNLVYLVLLMLMSVDDADAVNVDEYFQSGISGVADECFAADAADYAYQEHIYVCNAYIICY